VGDEAHGAVAVHEVAAVIGAASMDEVPHGRVKIKQLLIY